MDPYYVYAAEPVEEEKVLMPETMQFLSGPFALNMFDADPDSESDDGSIQTGTSDLLHGLACNTINYENHLICQPEYWQQFSTSLHVLNSSATAPIDVQLSNLDEMLDREGFLVASPEILLSVADLKELERVIRALKEKGWPPVFAFMFDDLWLLLDRVWDLMAPILGKDCILDPSVFLWALSPRKSAQKFQDPNDKSIGNNFGLPHRDFSFSESFFTNGDRKILNCWIPICDATLNNGCLYVLPKEFDEVFDQPESSKHMRAATPCYDQQHMTKLSFDLQGARPLPCKAGSIISWEGNLIHWGSRCSQMAKETSRISIACTFRSGKGQTETHLTKHLNSPPPLDRNRITRLSLTDRLRLIASSLVIYSDWYPLDEFEMPDEFY